VETMNICKNILVYKAFNKKEMCEDVILEVQNKWTNPNYVENNI